MTGSAHIVQGDARRLPLADDSVDLVVTSPPYFALRSYQDAGEHYAGQLGSEATPAEFVDALLEVTRECVRVLKPTGSLWVNLGDKYVADNRGSGIDTKRGEAKWAPVGPAGYPTGGMRQKSLMGLPWRYAIRCIDDLGLILRAEVIWSKPNGLPESVNDRVRRSHEQWFHFTLQPRYFSAVDEIREPHSGGTHRGRSDGHAPPGGKVSRQVEMGDRGGTIGGSNPDMFNPLGKLPGSVWTIPTEPLQVPDHLGVDHFAAFPTEWPRRIIMGWSPSGVCQACDEGRRPVVHKDATDFAGYRATIGHRQAGEMRPRAAAGMDRAGAPVFSTAATITGYACACTPYTDHAGTGERSPIESSRTIQTGRHGTPGQGSRPHQNPVGPWREYHFDQWTPAPTTPAVILDPFAGTGTVPLVAKALGRTGIGVELSGDYCRLAEWRVNDPDQLAKAARVEKPPRQIDGQEAFDLEGIA